MVKKPAQIWKPLINNVVILVFLVFNNAGRAIFIYTERINSATETCWVFMSKKNNVQNFFQIILKKFLKVSLQIKFASDYFFDCRIVDFK